MELEVIVKDGFENHFKNALMSFDKHAKIIKSKPAFIVETVTAQSEIALWTMVESVKHNEILKKIEPEIEKDSGTLTINSNMPSNGFSSGGWTGLGYVGNSIPAQQNISVSPSGLVLFTQNISLSSLLSQCAMCADAVTMTISDTKTGISFGLLKLFSTQNEVRLTIPTSSHSVVTIGDIRNIYSVTALNAHVMFDDNSGILAPVKNVKLSKTIHGLMSIILEI